MMVMRLAAAHARAATLVLLLLNMSTRRLGTDLFLIVWLDFYACWLPRDHLLLLRVIATRSRCQIQQKSSGRNVHALLNLFAADYGRLCAQCGQAQLKNPNPTVREPLGC